MAGEWRCVECKSAGTWALTVSNVPSRRLVAHSNMRPEKWAIVCEHNTTVRTSEAAASRLLADIVKVGMCNSEHKVVRLDA